MNSRDFSGHPVEALDKLQQRIDLMVHRNIVEHERVNAQLDGLERMNQALERLDRQKKDEALLVEKINRAYNRLEEISSGGAEKEFRPSINEVLHIVIHGAKATGQIIEIMASGLEVMVDSISGVIKSQFVQQQRNNTPEAGKNLKDAADFITPLGNLLSALLARQPQQKCSADSAGASEVKKEATRDKKGDEARHVPVVKAVPAD